MSGMICLNCGAPVDAIPGGGFEHRYDSDRTVCDWLMSRRDDDDPAVLALLEVWLR